MKPEYTSFKDLSPQTKSYKVRAKVIEKSEPKVFPNKTLFQSLQLEDSEGKRIRGALFDDEVQTFKGVLELGRTYEIQNAPLKSVGQQWKTSENDCQMTFGGKTAIQPLDAEAGPVIPKFIPLASVPRISNQGERFNVAGVVLYIERVRNVTTKKGAQLDVREVVIGDGSMYQPMIISLWGTLASEDCEKLNAWPTATVIAGFTYLRPTSHKGFSLASSMSTSIILNPAGQMGEDLNNWARNNRDHITELKAKVLGVRNPSDERRIVTLEEVKKKTFNNTMLEEHFWVHATIPEPNVEKLVAYVGFSNCGTRCGAAVGNPLNCYKCPEIECTASHRAIYSFSITDETEMLKLTAFGDDCERLFNMPLAKIHEHATSGAWDHFASAAAKISTTPLFFKIGPAYILRSAGALKWNLKYVSAE